MVKRVLDDELIDDISQKSGVLSKRPRVLAEEPVDQDHVDGLKDVVERADLRKICGIKNGSIIEVKWEVTFEDRNDGKNGLYWLKAKVIESECGECFRFQDEETKDFQDVPIIKIEYIDDITDEDEIVHEICLITNHTLYDIKHDNMLVWRHEGDKYDGCDYEEEIICNDIITFTSKNEINTYVNELVPKLLVNVFEKYKTNFEKLPVAVQYEYGRGIMKFKTKFEENLLTFLTKQVTNKSFPVDVSFTSDDVNKIINSSIVEVERDEDL